MLSSAYLRHLGIDHALAPTLGTLRLLQHRHLERLPYENLGIMLGHTPSVDPESSLLRVGELGRAGYCFHQNAVFEVVLRDLGYQVERRHGHVWSREEHRHEPSLNHLVLMVSGLPSDDNPAGRWWPDVGLGEGFWEPLPLVVGTYSDGPFTFEITEVRPDGWSYLNDPNGSFTGLEVTSRPTEPMVVLDAHAALSTPPGGRFTGLLVVQRRDEAGLDMLRGCVSVRIDAEGRHETDVTTYDACRGALVDLGLPLDGFAESELRALFERSSTAHESWDLAGRP